MMNEGWRLARTPMGGVPSMDDFEWFEAPIPSPMPGQMLTKTLYLSLDPYQWGRRRSGVEQPGETCHGRTVSQVVESRMDGFAAGDIVFNTNGWQNYGLSGQGISVFGYMHPRKIDPSLAPISTAVGILGMLGLTAYAGMNVQCRPGPGDTVVVSAASGGVGQAAAQLAKLKGATVIGIAGAQEKCEYVLNALGLDGCVSHHSPTLADDLARACPNGIDVYFESVGGKVFEAVLPLLNQNARISRCGLISQYFGADTRDDKESVWLRTGKQIFEARNAEVHNLVVREYVDEYQEPCFREMGDWVREGKLNYKEDVWSGLATAPEAFLAMLSGGNFGKTLVTVNDDPTGNADIAVKRTAGNTLG
jgi:NADPH-dependent curcumin reductase